MAKVKDILIDDTTADLKFNNGDFAFGSSDNQHIILIINTHVGSWKQSPTCGVGILQYLCSAGQGATLRRSMSVQLEADGYPNAKIDLKEGVDNHFEYNVSAERI